MSPGDSHLLLSVATPLQEERAGWRLFHEEIHKKTVGSWIMKIPLVSHTIHANSIFLCIHHKHQPNVGKYIIHGWCGYDFNWIQQNLKLIGTIPKFPSTRNKTYTPTNPPNPPRMLLNSFYRGKPLNRVIPADCSLQNGRTS